MSDRVQHEFGVAKPIQSGISPMRPHLAVGPAPEAAENTPVAVAPPSSLQKTGFDEVPSEDKALLQRLSNVHRGGDMLAKNAERRKEVDAILARLFNAKESAPTADMDLAALNNTVESLEERFPGLSGGGEPKTVDEAKNAAERVKIQDRARVIAKIEAAMNRVEKLRSEISLGDEDAYTHLLNVGSAVSGLTVARNRVSETFASLSSAANTADNVMVNLRAVVLGAHGKISPEIVRLVLP